MYSKKRKLEDDTPPCENLLNDKERNIYSDGNKIYFFSPIDKYSIFCLNKEIDEVVFNLKLNKHISPLFNFIFIQMVETFMLVLVLWNISELVKSLYILM